MVTVLSALVVLETETEAGEKLQVAEMGRPVQARATVPLKLKVGAMAMVAVVDDPAVTVSAPAEALRP